MSRERYVGSVGDNDEEDDDEDDEPAILYGVGQLRKRDENGEPSSPSCPPPAHSLTRARREPDGRRADTVTEGLV